MVAQSISNLFFVFFTIQLEEIKFDKYSIRLISIREVVVN